jgi:hypothetical protein
MSFWLMLGLAAAISLAGCIPLFANEPHPVALLLAWPGYLFSALISNKKPDFTVVFLTSWVVWMMIFALGQKLWSTIHDR